MELEKITRPIKYYKDEGFLVFVVQCQPCKRQWTEICFPEADTNRLLCPNCQSRETKILVER